MYKIFYLYNIDTSLFRVNDVVLNIDLAPTILDIAGIPVPTHMDGRSLMKLFQNRKKNGRKYMNNWPDTFLIER